MADRFGYPAPRPRDTWPPRAPLPGFIAHESTRGYVTVTDAEGDIIRFSGPVQRVDLRAETFGVIVTLTDRDLRERDTITLRANESRTVDVVCTVVRAANAVAGSVGALQVIGYFQQSGHLRLEPQPPPELVTSTPPG